MRVRLEHLEIGPIRDADFRYRPSCGGVDQHSVRIENVDAADVRQCAQLGLEHEMDILAGHPTLVILARGDPARSHIRNEVLLNDLEVFELLIEMAGQQQHGIFQLAFA